MERESVAELVRELLLGEPSLQKCLELGVVNYSRVANKLRPTLSKLLGREVSLEAIKMALIRSRSRGERPLLNRDVLGVLAGSRIEVRTGITIIIVGAGSLEAVMELVTRASRRARYVAVMQSGAAATILLDNEAAEELLASLDDEGVIEVQRDYAAIVLVSPPSVMWVPGVLAYVAGVLAQNGINVVHVESCYTDTVVVVSKDDVMRAFNVLARHVELARALLAEGESRSQH
ncbi:MAG: ACT domain-containing protein [Desulfurococcaceae archaeon]